VELKKSSEANVQHSKLRWHFNVTFSLMRRIWCFIILIVRVKSSSCFTKLFWVRFILHSLGNGSQAKKVVCKKRPPLTLPCDFVTSRSTRVCGDDAQGGVRKTSWKIVERNIFFKKIVQNTDFFLVTIILPHFSIKTKNYLKNLNDTNINDLWNNKKRAPVPLPLQPAKHPTLAD